MIVVSTAVIVVVLVLGISGGIVVGGVVSQGSHKSI